MEWYELNEIFIGFSYRVAAGWLRIGGAGSVVRGFLP